MADSSRIEDLRRRVHKDPASIAFAQLAEECRRAGELEEAVQVCRAGLALHPGYLSARVTLGRALLELNQLDDAQTELEQVLRGAPENLAALRALAETLHRRGDLGDALTQYRAALSLAKNDPELQQTVQDLAHEVEPAAPPPTTDGLSYEQAAREFLLHAPPTPKTPAPKTPAPKAAGAAAKPAPPAAPLEIQHTSSLSADALGAIYAEPEPALVEPPPPAIDEAPPIVESAPLVVEQTRSIAEQEPEPPEDTSARDRAARTIVALEQWLEAVHVSRTERGA